MKLYYQRKKCKTFGFWRQLAQHATCLIIGKLPGAMSKYHTDAGVALFHETERNLTKPNETEQLLSSNVLQKCIK